MGVALGIVSSALNFQTPLSVVLDMDRRELLAALGFLLFVMGATAVFMGLLELQDIQAFCLSILCAIALILFIAALKV